MKRKAKKSTSAPPAAAAPPRANSQADGYNALGIVFQRYYPRVWLALLFGTLLFALFKPRNQDLNLGELNSKLVLLLQLQNDVCSLQFNSEGLRSKPEMDALRVAMELRSLKTRDRLVALNGNDKMLAAFDEFIVGIHKDMGFVMQQQQQGEGDEESEMRDKFQRIKAEVDALLQGVNVKDSVKLLRVARKERTEDGEEGEDEKKQASGEEEEEEDGDQETGQQQYAEGTD